MKRRGFSHEAAVKGGRARAGMKRAEHGRFARLLHGGGTPKGRKTVIHVEGAELARLRAERGLTRSPSAAPKLRFGRAPKKVYARSFEVHRVKPLKATGGARKVYNPKYRGTFGGF